MQVEKAFLLALTLISSLPLACAPAPVETRAPIPAPAVLPLRVLRLYETGVGYFERSGAVAGDVATSLPVPAGHLDDALASLVVLRSGSGGQIAGLSFASSVTKATARSSAGLPPDPLTPITFQDLLESLKGARVAIQTHESPTPIEGRVVEVAMEVDEAQARVVAENRDGKREDPKRLVVTMLTARGELTRVPSESIVRIRPTDPAFAARLDAALDALGTRSAQNARALRLLGDSRGQVTFGYIAETPIWRASYRLIIGDAADKGAPTAVLQGWALVHNDTDETWHDVHLELVNGEPDSFVFPMAAPRYTRRALVHPDDPLSTVPQLADTTADALWGDNLDSSDGGIGHGEGFGYGHGMLGGSHVAHAPRMRMGATRVDGRTTGSSLLSVGNLADLAPATGAEQGAFFVYSVPGGLSLEAHASGLVPFVQRSVAAPALAFFAHPGAGGRAAFSFVNGTGQTLPAGTVTIFAAGGFVGETSIDRLKPGERRFLQAGNDLDGEVKEKRTERREESKRLTFEGEELDEHFLRTTEATWELENRSGASKTFYVALAADRNARVTGADRVDFDEASSTPVVVFDVKPKEKSSRSFRVMEGLSRSFGADGLTVKVVRSLLDKATLPMDERTILREALPRVESLEAGHAMVVAAEHAAESAQQDLERLREDLKAVGGGSGAGGAGTVATPLVMRVVAAEDQVVAARKNRAAADKTLEERRDLVRAALRRLSSAPTN